MPSRRILPTLSIFSRKSTTPTIAPTSSPSSDIRNTSIPLTPPARLHLRPILPSTPDGMPTPPPPPRKPFPWLWQCHSCDTVYRIGCTRRCLVCSHDYCLSATTPKTRRGKKRRRSGMCASEFDYNGWAEWGAWRRKVLGMETVGQSEKRREQAFLYESHNCMIDCNYPSECHHVRYKLRAQRFRKTLLEALPEEPQSPPIVASVPMSPDDDLPLNEARAVLEEEDQGNEQRSPTSPRSPLGEMSLPEDESEQKEDKVWWADTEDHDTNIQSTQETQKLTAGLEGPGEANSSAAGTEDFNSETLYAALAEDENMMPLDLVDYVASTRRESKQSSREHPKHSSELTVRNFTDADRCEDWEESTDSDSDSGSVSSLHSSSSSLDGGWLLASKFVPAPEAGSEHDENMSGKKSE
ncbi:hypothetical protein F4813DRAFT_363631 [Daldinia decipiens]|uniref:uncharacterized protein n=1 Tax=Daldinia decipiens TaxID=326647 RepID=UPI0020C2E59E|nr:uncharacterized protein F4813DRAFT_363631 [Daldinia decipiens]KAI1656552.1 hypothetical protein F4813DRAFT_363631 [Daldinia decipiens]